MNPRRATLVLIYTARQHMPRAEHLAIARGDAHVSGVRKAGLVRLRAVTPAPARITDVKWPSRVGEGEVLDPVKEARVGLQDGEVRHQERQCVDADLEQDDGQDEPEESMAAHARHKE